MSLVSRRHGLALLVLLVACFGTATASTCPVDSPNVVFIGNSLTGGMDVGRACEENETGFCREQSIPGNVYGFYQDPASYPGQYDEPPSSTTLQDSTIPYNPISNPHIGDVPGKINLLADQICPAGVFDYVQNTQSAFTTRVHAGQASSNLQYGSLNLLDDTTRPPYNTVVIQPQSTEYLDGATELRRDALRELTRPRNNAPNARFIVQQTWPRRGSTEYNQVCSTKGQNRKDGMLEKIDKTLADLSSIAAFTVAPTGDAFVEFAKLACGSNIVSGCVIDASVECPLWFGESGKVSLFAEDVSEEQAIHQSDEIGAWLSATVLYGVIHSDTPCVVSQADLASVMPVPTNLASNTQGLSIHYLVSQAAKEALERQFGTLLTECGSSGSGPTTTTAAPPGPSESTTATAVTTTTAVVATTTNSPPVGNCGGSNQVCCVCPDNLLNADCKPCADGVCKKNGRCPK